jgi:hypothetical protein
MSHPVPLRALCGDKASSTNMGSSQYHNTVCNGSRCCEVALNHPEPSHCSRAKLGSARCYWSRVHSAGEGATLLNGTDDTQSVCRNGQHRKGSSMQGVASCAAQRQAPRSAAGKIARGSLHYPAPARSPGRRPAAQGAGRAPAADYSGGATARVNSKRMEKLQTMRDGAPRLRARLRGCPGITSRLWYTASSSASGADFSRGLDWARQRLGRPARPSEAEEGGGPRRMDRRRVGGENLPFRTSRRRTW